MTPYKIQLWRVLDEATNAGEWLDTHDAPKFTRDGLQLVEFHSKQGRRARLVGNAGQVIADSGYIEDRRVTE